MKNTRFWKQGDAFFKLNLPAWDVFLNCNDKQVLRIALAWSDLSIKIDTHDPNIQYLDTRANILYKLGRVREAIAQEENAIKMSYDIAKKQGREKGPFIDNYTRTVAKMKNGEPTYLDEGAIWDSKLL